jgi:transcriptional regulator with XRE-family HTH domain
MYKEIIEKYRLEGPQIPLSRRPLVGSVIKRIRVDKGIRQIDFAKKVGINEATLKSIENDHQQATTVDNLERMAAELGTTADELILLGRERDPANFFPLKHQTPQEIAGIRKRKRSPLEWHESVRLRFKNFDITPISPPLTAARDFFICRINLPPKRSIDNLALGMHIPVIGFVSSGFNIKITYGNRSHGVTTNQGFALDGFYRHSITNEDDDAAAVIYLMTKISSKMTSTPGPEAKSEMTINVAKGIEALRRERSDRPHIMLSVKHLADLTDNLDHEQIAKMMRLKKGSSVVYWEKIEDLLGGTRVSMDDFLGWAHQQPQKPFELANAKTRALIDFSTYYGVSIYSCVPPSKSDLFCGELRIEGQGSLSKKSWERKDAAMIALYLEDGELEITVGKSRSTLPLGKGESIYFDGSLGYIIRNPGKTAAKSFMASFPAIQF